MQTQTTDHMAFSVHYWVSKEVVRIVVFQGWWDATPNSYQMLCYFISHLNLLFKNIILPTIVKIASFLPIASRPSRSSAQMVKQFLIRAGSY